MMDTNGMGEPETSQDTHPSLASLVPITPTDGFHDWDAYEVVDVDGSRWLGRLVQSDEGWYCVADDGSRVWFLVSLWHWSALARDIIGLEWRVMGSVRCTV
ncbi:MAG TPA: hypothetical protein VNG51_29195 [Ktedonobacteraceae bacterium]|nr:hypothetical protein [Ktedonobacteraceae bacterium]